MRVFIIHERLVSFIQYVRDMVLYDSYVSTGTTSVSHGCIIASTLTLSPPKADVSACVAFCLSVPV